MTLLGLALCIQVLAHDASAQSKRVHHSVLQWEIHSVDPLRSVETNSQMIITNAYDGLVRWTAAKGIEPVIAVSWAFSKDRREIKFKLRPSVKFQDGATLTAKEARDHFLRVLDYNGYYSAHFENIESITAPTPTGLVFRLKKPSAYFLQLLSGVAGRIVKLDENGQVTGSGPFRPIIDVEKKSVSLIRDAGYWGEPPAVDLLEFRVLDEREAVEKARAGELDDLGIFSISQEEAAKLPAGKSLRQPLWATWAIGFDQRMKPLDRMDVRLQLAGKIKSADWIAEFFPDQTPAFGLLPFGMPGYLDSPQTAAKAEMPRSPAAAGSVIIEIPDYFELTPKFAAWIEDKARGIPGVSVQAKPAPFDSMMARYAKGVMGGYLVSYNAEYPDPSFLLRALHSKSRSNFLGIEDPRVDRWIAQADSEFDPVKRAEVFRAFNSYLIQHADLLPLMHVIHTTWIRACADGLELSPVGEGYFNYRGIKNSCR